MEGVFAKRVIEHKSESFFYRTLDSVLVAHVNEDHHPATNPDRRRHHDDGHASLTGQFFKHVKEVIPG